MTIPTELIGSLPRTQPLMDAMQTLQPNEAPGAEWQSLLDAAVRETVTRLEATGSPVISDGEQGKYQNFINYPVYGQTNFSSAGFNLSFANGHQCQLPRLNSGPFHYQQYADEYLTAAREYTDMPIKQAVISPAILSLLYPADPLPNYSRDIFIDDLLTEHISEIRRCLEQEACKVQIDFIEGPLAIQLDGSGQILNSFILLLNLALDRLSTEERLRIGIYIGASHYQHSDYDQTVDYAELLPSLFELPVGSFYIALANQPDQNRLLNVLHNHIKPGQRTFVGVVDPINARVESVEEIRDRILEAAKYIPAEQLGTTDNSGFCPFASKPFIDRDTAFAKIRARVEGTALASEILEGG